jgi:hypothetical protein
MRELSQIVNTDRYPLSRRTRLLPMKSSPFDYSVTCPIQSKHPAEAAD